MKLLKKLRKKEQAIPKSCFTCKWFKLRKDPPRIRVCTLPKPIYKEDIRKGYCRYWELEPDPKKRTMSFI
ncbi:MAG: hypothetical protein DRP08_06325 [Candidatus Aenigmatarchaeota archaeon]|nr:MAG: hypothetical protein DRP08_06325 [Candidatus Aenigmarchaeota archaeon]